MPKKAKEYDYLHLSARVRVLENRLLTRERMERMLDARTAEEAAKVLTECGYPELGTVTPTGVENALSAARHEMYAELRKLVPDEALLDVFGVKYDYHNIKALLKARVMGVPAGDLLIGAGRYDPRELEEAFQAGSLELTSATFQTAAEQAAQVLDETGDPQKADFILDRAYYAELLEAAKAAGSDFLTEYVRVSIDAANLRSAVRASRMGQGPEFLNRVLVPGGKVEPGRIAAALAGSGDLAALFSSTPLAAAAQAGAEAMEGGPLTRFERLCDDAVTAQVRKARGVPFGEQPLVGYLYAKEAEQTAVRVILNGKQAGLDRATIEERLRDSYA